MKSQSLKFLLALTFLFLFSGFSVVFGGDLKDGVVAYERKDYEAAIKLLMPLAKHGDPQAQLQFGKMFQNGQGVPRDHKEAAKWYFLSAEQGHLSSNNLYLHCTI
jgi:TPR repeat protein